MLKRLLTLACLLLASPAWAQNGPIGYGTPSAAAETSRILKTTGGQLFDFQVNTGAVAVWVMLIDSATVPAAGGAAVAPVKWWQVPVNSTLGVSWDAGAPLLMINGITLICSSTGPFTYTATSTCTFSGEVR